MTALHASRVLVVEDEIYIAMAIEEALEEAGYESPGRAASEAEALRLAAEQRPAFAVLDMHLGPGGSGLNVRRELTVQGVAILCASGNCLSDTKEMRKTGTRAYLTKPFSLADLPKALAALAKLIPMRTPALAS
jgi:DNA-binding response OmpR family regulator